MIIFCLQSSLDSRTVASMADELVPFTTRIPEVLRREIRIVAAQRDCSVEYLVKTLLEVGLKNLEPAS
jgi:predicted HicB family RNase H-like nuclease